MQNSLSHSCRVSDADIALCVLSLPDILEDAEGGSLKIPENVSPMLAGDKTIMLLNKADLLAPSDIPRSDCIVSSIEQDFGVEKAWMVSISTRAGIATFLREFGDILKKR